jgi:hypothetical protein
VELGAVVDSARAGEVYREAPAFLPELIGIVCQLTILPAVLATGLAAPSEAYDSTADSTDHQLATRAGRYLTAIHFDRDRSFRNRERGKLSGCIAHAYKKTQASRIPLWPLLARLKHLKRGILSIVVRAAAGKSQASYWQVATNQDR